MTIAKAHIDLPSNAKIHNMKLESNPMIAKLETGSSLGAKSSKPAIEHNVEDALFLDPNDAAFPVAPVSTAPKAKQKVVIEIKKVPVDKSVLENVIERFKKERDPYDSLFVASTYYSNGEYAKAHDWAVETNKIANINESWMVLAKAKYKLGKKEEALELLRSFLKTQDSKEAEVLIKKIQKRYYLNNEREKSMLKIIEMMLRDKLITKDNLSTLVKCRPPKKVSVANLIAENMLDADKTNEYLAKKIRQGEITLSDVEQIEGIDSKKYHKNGRKRA